MHFNMRRSMDIPPPLHLSNQSDNEIPSQYTPITPFDISYGQSMIPSNLLMNSPYFTPPPTASQYFPPQYSRNSSRTGSQSSSPRGTHSKLRLNGNKGINNNHQHDNTRKMHYISSMGNGNPKSAVSMNQMADQPSCSRTVIFKNISENVSMHEFLDAIDFGPIEYCKIFSKPTPRLTKEKYPESPDSMQICYVSFSNYKIALAFSSKYTQDTNLMEGLKEKLKNSTYLKIQLNDTQGKHKSTSYSNQDYLKLKTLNYILEFNATRCLTISFSAAHEIPENVETDSAHESIKSSILNHCEKFGEVEDFVFDIKSSKDICGKVVVHFCSIDSAIKAYENLSKRINQNSRYDRKENSHSDTTNASSTKSFNSLNDIRFSGVEFGKDRCDKNAVYSERPVLYSSSSKNHIQCIPEDEETGTEDQSKDVSNLKEFITSPEIERVPGTLNIADPISPNSSDVDGGSPMKSPIVNGESGLESPSLSNADYSVASFSPRFHSSFPQPPYLPGNSMMTNSNVSLVSLPGPDPQAFGNRSIYLGNLHPSTTIEEIANNVRAGGLVESINYRPEKRVCFITFIDPNIAYKFFMSHQVLHQLVIHGYEVTVGWANQPSGPLPRDIGVAVSSGATRNVYIGIKTANSSALDSSEKVTKIPLPSEKELREDFGKFGPLEQINFIHNRESGFMNFLRIADAIKVVSIFEHGVAISMKRLKRVFKLEEEAEKFYNRYKTYKVSFAKDRCGNPPKFSFKKRSTDHPNMYQQYDHHSTSSLRHLRGNQESHSSDKNSTNEYNKEVIAQEAAMVFGIVSKTNADSQGNTSTELSDVPETKEEDGEVHEYAAPKSTNTQNGENTDKGNKLEDIKEQKTERNGDHNKDREEENNDEEEDDDDEVDDDDDYDDVSIIIGSDDTASFNNSFNKETKGEHKSSRSRPRYQKIYHNSYSEPSFRRSSSNLSINGSMNYSQGPYMQPQPVYFLPHLSRNNSSSSFMSSNMYGPPGNVPPPHPYFVSPPQFIPQPQVCYPPMMQVPSGQANNPYSSSGSQVMAQYLAKSQQDNMMYGMIPNNGDTFDNSFDDNGLYASRRSAGSFRRGYKK